MSDALLADGIVSGLGEKVAAFIVKCLAVGGGFLLGYFLGGAVAWALNRWVFAQKAPDQLKKAVAVLMGVALAILVALIVFGDGGGGLFGGGGSGEGPVTPDDGKQGPPPVVPKDEKKEQAPKPPPVKPTPGDVPVTILAGDEVRGGKFYVIGDQEPKTFEEFKEAVAKRRQEMKEELVLVFRFKGAELSATHPEMQRLTAWLKQAKLLNRFE